MNKTVFYKQCPKTKAGFIARFNSDYIFRNYAKNFGFSVVGDNVFFPNGAVAGANVK